MNYEKTGRLIAQRRAERGMTQIQLADRLGVSNRAVSKWERGKGFPDVSLLEPLSNELGLSLQALISGEADEIQSQTSVWRIVSFISQLSWDKTKRFVRRGICCLVLAVIFGFFVFAMLDYTGAFLKEIETVIPATVYQDGVAVGETSVSVQGSLKTFGKGKDNFVGRFQIACVDKTADENLMARITWNVIGEGFHDIVYFRFGPEYIETGIRRYLYISRDMQSFALELDDGSIIATSPALAELESATAWRYNISYSEFFYSEKS